ncbi:MAG: efflux RND transporter periplasmic adaptor subunit [Planctomycetes bacterium]|nr:efflux RND transporter periplasmic adaptor subunit [Planctomycetota bacterium]
MADEVRTAGRDLSALRIDRDAPRRGAAGRLLAVLLLALGGAAGVAAWDRFLRTPRLPEVETAVVRRVGPADAGALLSAGGYLLPDKKANVSSKAFGRLEWLGFEVGSRVVKDQVLARLANADLAASVEEAKVAVADGERELTRWRAIVDSAMEARERLDRAQTVLDLARARLKSAEAALEYTLIRAPFAGVIVRKGAEIGETLGPAAGSGAGSAGSALCTLIDPDSIEMVADVNEANIAKLREGQPAEIVADALPDRRYAGTIRQIVPTADRQKGVVQVKVRLLDRDAALLPEMAARATFLRAGATAGAAKRVLAPKAALRERGGRRFLLLVEAGRVRFAPVETGPEGEDGVEIVSGLAGGEVAVVGGDPVEEGAAVRIREKK